VERATALAEARFRRDLWILQERQWSDVEAACFQTLERQFRVLSRQSAKAVAEDYWTIPEATAHAIQFLAREAGRIHSWLAAHGHQWRHRSGSYPKVDAPISFSNSFATAFQRLPIWRRFLRALARAAAPTRTRRLTPNEQRLAAFKLAVKRQMSHKASNAEIYRVAGYIQKKEFYEWRRGAAGRTPTERFDSVLALSPADFVAKIKLRKATRK